MLLELYQEVNSPVTRKDLARTVRLVFSVLKIRRNFFLSLAVIKESNSRRLNWTFRKIDRATSVLSFVAKEQNKSSRFIIPSKKKFFLGEIIITPAVVKRIAKEKNSSYQNEFTFLFIHGLLHLLGYVHNNRQKKKRMEGAEKRIMKKLFSPKPNSPKHRAIKLCQ